MSAVIESRDLDKFTLAYIEAMLFAETLPPFGKCPACERENQVLSSWTSDQTCVCTDCSERPSNHEPPANNNYDFEDLSEEIKTTIVADCKKFQEENKADIQTGPSRQISQSSSQQAGHDFWLTRAGHGCGFWDGDWPEEAGERLTKASKEFGEQYLYVGDDGKLYFG